MSVTTASTSSTVSEQQKISSLCFWLPVVLMVVTVAPATSLGTSKWSLSTSVLLPRRTNTYQNIQSRRRSFSTSSFLCFPSNLNNDNEFSIVTGANGYLGR
jgi:hypothetical protein